ncbi:MAG: hypothetical protein K2J79_00350 [Ruminiclostridium sp.]|nr:hypothetical protein [Ruminiclostridium sp.]
MELQIIPKQTEIPPFDPKAIKLQHIEYFDPPYSEYEGEEITEAVIAEILHKIPSGLNIYLSLEPEGEDSWLEVNCDGQWLSIWYWSEEGEDNYFLYNSSFADTEKQVRDGDFSDQAICTPLLSGGQSPIAKLNAITDIETGVKAVEYFVRTGEFYPGLDWWHEHEI